MKFQRFLCAALLAALSSISLPARATLEGEHGPSAEVQSENVVAKIEIARLRIHNVQNGPIEGSRDGGKSWQLLGRVLQPTIKVNRKGYTASKYGPPGTVVATAVNAIHLKAAYDKVADRGVIWTLSPASNSAAGKTSLQSEVSPGSSVFTDIAGGRGIFGGPFAPFVGNRIYLDNDRNNVLKALPPSNYVPKLGETWTIVIERPRKYPTQITFENRFGGLIYIHYRGEKPKPIGQVLRPVLGVGRFVGSYFTERGRLRANHNGVIDVGLAPPETTGTVGRVGSFQIVPANHAMSPETHYIRSQTQWMVVGPVSALDPSWEGTAPLFNQFLRPRFDPADVQGDWVEDLAGRFYFDGKFRDKKGVISDWQPLPYLYLDPNKPLPLWSATALQDMTHLRIVFPFVYNDNSEILQTGQVPVIAPDGTTQSTLDAAAQDDKKADNPNSAEALPNTDAVDAQTPTP